MYQVETFTTCEGWCNTWQDNDKPLLFDSWADAVFALAEFYSDMSEDHEAGFLSDPVNYKDYRIVEVSPC